MVEGISERYRHHATRTPRRVHSPRARCRPRGRVGRLDSRLRSDAGPPGHRTGVRGAAWHDRRRHPLAFRARPRPPARHQPQHGRGRLRPVEGRGPCPHPARQRHLCRTARTVGPGRALLAGPLGLDRRQPRRSTSNGGVHHRCAARLARDRAGRRTAGQAAAKALARDAGLSAARAAGAAPRDRPRLHGPRAADRPRANHRHERRATSDRAGRAAFSRRARRDGRPDQSGVARRLSRRRRRHRRDRGRRRRRQRRRAEAFARRANAGRRLQRDDLQQPDRHRALARAPRTQLARHGRTRGLDDRRGRDVVRHLDARRRAAGADRRARQRRDGALDRLGL